MSHAFVFFKLFGDTALYLALSCGALSFFTPVSNLALAAPAIGLGALAADWLGPCRPRLRWLGLLPALAALLFCRRWVDLLLAVPPVVYLGWCIVREALDPDSSEIYYRFKGLTAVALVASLLCAVKGADWGFLCGILSLAVNVFLMRMLRHDEAERRSGRLMSMELGLLTGVCVLCLLLTQRPVLLAVREVVKGVVTPVLLLILVVMTAIIRGLYWLLFHVIALLQKIFPPAEPPEEPEMENTFSEMLAPVQEKLFPGQESMLPVILRAIGIVIFLVAAVLLFRYLMSRVNRRRAAAPLDERRRTLSPSEQEERPGTPRFWDRSPDATVRRAFAAYCKAVKRCRGVLLPGDTTRSVNRRAELESDPAAGELRRLYLRARYTDRGGLTREDAKIAAALSRELRGKLEQISNEDRS